MRENPATAIAVVAVGGATGAVCRHAMEVWLGPVGVDQWPWPIFIVNMIGCLVVGLLIGRFTRQRRFGNDPPQWLRLLLITGFLGGFTTFSTYIWEVVGLADEAGRLILAMGYLFASVVAGMVLVVIGLRVGLAGSAQPKG